MPDLSQYEEIGLFKRPPAIIDILRAVLKSVAIGCVGSVLATNSISFLNPARTSLAWIIGAVLGGLLGPFLDLGEFHTLRWISEAVVDPDRQYPNARIYLPDDNGVVHLKFWFPFKTVALDRARRVFVFRQTWRQYLVDGGFKRFLQLVFITLSIETGLIWCSLASLLRERTGLFRPEFEFRALLLGPAAALILTVIVRFLSKIRRATAQKAVDVDAN